MIKLVMWYIKMLLKVENKSKLSQSIKSIIINDNCK